MPDSFKVKRDYSEMYAASSMDPQSRIVPSGSAAFTAVVSLENDEQLLAAHHASANSPFD